MWRWSQHHISVTTEVMASDGELIPPVYSAASPGLRPDASDTTEEFAEAVTSSFLSLQTFLCHSVCFRCQSSVYMSKPKLKSLFTCTLVLVLLFGSDHDL